MGVCRNQKLFEQISLYIMNYYDCKIPSRNNTKIVYNISPQNNATCIIKAGNVFKLI